MNENIYRKENVYKIQFEKAGCAVWCCWWDAFSVIFEFGVIWNVEESEKVLVSAYGFSGASFRKWKMAFEKFGKNCFVIP
jgi:hypothetical protein